MFRVKGAEVETNFKADSTESTQTSIAIRVLEKVIVFQISRREGYGVSKRVGRVQGRARGSGESAQERLQICHVCARAKLNIGFRSGRRGTSIS